MGFVFSSLFSGKSRCADDWIGHCGFFCEILKLLQSFSTLYRIQVRKACIQKPAEPQAERVSGFPQSPPALPQGRIYSMAVKNFPLEERGDPVSRDALVQAALTEITQNYREASLSNVARAYGVSLAYVSECVRAQTGKTYKELLQKHRMETAARLLRRSDLNIQQIIAQVGYENTSYFYRLFHERYGQSPREYRRSRMSHTRTGA